MSIVSSFVFAFSWLLVSVVRSTHADHIVALNLTTLSSTRLPKPLSDGTAVYQNKVIYLHGGCDSPNGNQFNNVSGRFECRSVSNSSYAFLLEEENATIMIRMLPDMPTPRFRHAAVALSNQIILVGGRSVSDELIGTVDVRIGRPRLLFTYSSEPMSPPTPQTIPHHFLSLSLSFKTIRSTIFQRETGAPTTWRMPSITYRT
jgi:hypothetical protein